MDKRKTRWQYYIIGWDKGPTYTLAGTTTAKWPTDQYETRATRQGYTEFRRDNTLIGGYFAHPKTGDCLVLIPVGMDIKELF